MWRSRRVGYRVRGLGKARPLTSDDGHEGSTLDGKRAHVLRLGNDTGDTQTPPAVGDVAPIDGQVHELAAPDDALAEPLGSLPKARRTCVNPNPPKDTDGRREDSGRVGEGATGEMAGLIGVDWRSANGLSVAA